MAGGNAGAQRTLGTPNLASLPFGAIPWVIPTAAPFNAKGDGITDDAAAFRTAEAFALSVGGMLLIPPGTFRLGSAYTTSVPVTFAGGVLLVDVSLDVTKPMTAEAVQIFSGAGIVTLEIGAVRGVYAEWWGVTGTADNVAIEKALVASRRYFPVNLLPGKTYTLAAPLTISEALIPSAADGVFTGVTLRGMSPESHTILLGAFSDATRGLLDVGNRTATVSTPERDHTIENILFASAVTNLCDGIQLFNVQQSRFRNLRFCTAGHGVYGRGVNLLLQFEEIYYQVDTAPDDKRAWSRSNGKYGITFDNGTYNTYGGAANSIFVDGGWFVAGARGISFEGVGAGRSQNISLKNITGDGGPVTLFYLSNVWDFCIENVYAEQADALCTNFVNAQNCRDGFFSSIYSTGGTKARWDISGASTLNLSIGEITLNGATNFTIDPTVPASAVAVSDATSFVFPALVPSPSILRRTFQNVTYFVDTTNGSDTYDGRSLAVSGLVGPLKTIQAAIDRLPKLLSHDITISVVAGSYVGEVPTINGFFGPGSLTINRSGAGTVTVGTNNGVRVQNTSCKVTLDQMTVQCNLGGGLGISITNSRNVVIGTVAVNYGGSGGCVGLQATTSSVVQINGLVAGTGTVGTGLQATTGAQIYYDHTAVVPFGTLFQSATTGGFIENDATFMLRSQVTMNNGAAALTATMTNSPVTGNPTKWLPYDDNGTRRYIPAW